MKATSSPLAHLPGEPSFSGNTFQTNPGFCGTRLWLRLTFGRHWTCTRSTGHLKQAAFYEHFANTTENLELRVVLLPGQSCQRAAVECYISCSQNTVYRAHVSWCHVFQVVLQPVGIWAMSSCGLIGARVRLKWQFAQHLQCANPGQRIAWASGSPESCASKACCKSLLVPLLPTPGCSKSSPRTAALDITTKNLLEGQGERPVHAEDSIAFAAEGIVQLHHDLRSLVILRKVTTTLCCFAMPWSWKQILNVRKHKTCQGGITLACFGETTLYMKRCWVLKFHEPTT